MIDYATKFPAGLSYGDFLASHGSDEHRRRWADTFAKVKLNDRQIGLVRSFSRQMPVVCLAGAWCGDCVNQCPIFEHFSRLNDKLLVRYFDRDAHADLAAELKICGGARVPTVVFLSEDFCEVGRYGDRTLAKYRQLVSDQAGPSCSTGLIGPDRSLLDAVVQDWLDEFERAQWILRTSSRLRQKHGD